jgi:CO/xanthine dehydrogenase Mo-binding subunit
VRNVLGPVVIGEPESALAAAEVLVESTSTTPYAQHMPLELRTGLYQWDGDVLTTWQTTHRTFDVRRELRPWSPAWWAGPCDRCLPARSLS